MNYEIKRKKIRQTVNEYLNKAMSHMGLTTEDGVSYFVHVGDGGFYIMDLGDTISYMRVGKGPSMDEMIETLPDLMNEAGIEGMDHFWSLFHDRDVWGLVKYYEFCSMIRDDDYKLERCESE